MGKKRIYELSKEMRVASKKILDTARSKGMDVKNHMSTLSDSDEKVIRNIFGKNTNHSKKPSERHHNNNSMNNNSNQHQQSNNNHSNDHVNNNHGNSNHANNHVNNNHSNNNQKSNFNNNFKQGKKNKKKFNKRHNRHNRFAGMYTKNQRIRQNNKKNKAPERKERPLPETFVYNAGMNAQEIGKALHREPAEIVKKLFMLGVMVNQNVSLDKDTIELLAADYGIKAEEKEVVNVSDLDKFFEEEENNKEHQEDRAPVVTIMGHVDHGKTTLLDYLRNSHITAGEAGGITQAIGAYQLKKDGKTITFLDTPGHAAFTAMRARGADITDITILVVAADDGVMPQTIEAIDHAKAAKTPIIVAINKIDKPGANPNHVIEQLTGHGLVPEDWGGDTIFVEISAKMGTNVDELIDMILLESDVMELKANPDQNAAGSVIEARLDRGRGPVATLLVQQGTMHVGDPIVVGDTFGRVRTMMNEKGKKLDKATPSTPIEVTGLNDVPEAGDRFIVFDDEKTARAAGEERAKEAQMEERKKNNSVTLDNLFDSIKEGEKKEVDVIIKADVQGSVEALASSLQKIDVEGVKVNIVHSSVGAINESDVALAEASNAIILGFNVRATSQAREQADTDKVDIRLHQVIYDAIDEVESAMKGMLAPKYKEVITGEVEVRQLYKASKVGTIAGGMVTNGYVRSDSKIRLIRDNVVVYNGELNSLKRFKDDTKEVKQGFECGLTIENYNDIKEGDVIEAYKMEQIPVK
ncbi:translation initiation factor IF-2 [Apilactobacillus micheneri]|uniref:translation initiation factor IF-2 n=1 Tax=Apilactobacillus micheneri TaxID=1899430 RepID=UPI001129727D|nr:translation initiation factor IF-2 [Apilactobacillus micheneri]TPR44854.1 translation initiation factor IF-2 [Apilactobacillus micheneri]TPR48411.1 translation initiation factor IF-2 [Apilactobacillus micheneri]